MSNPPSLSISEYGLISPSGFFGGTFLNWTAVMVRKSQKKQLLRLRISLEYSKQLNSTLHSSHIIISIDIHGHNAFIDYHSTALWGKHIALIYNWILKGNSKGSYKEASR